MTTSHILMVRPAAFEYNSQTAVNNSFQESSHQPDVNIKALEEFDHFTGMLRENGLNICIVQDSPVPPTPDSIFPNNWVSFHEDGTAVLYPMFAANRRDERGKAVIKTIDEHFYIRSVTDLSFYEQENVFLEGTGSMVLDRDHEIAFACLSPRTDATALYDFCDAMGYRPVLFNAVNAAGTPIYHTNVMMNVGDEFVVICLSSIPDTGQQQMLLDKFKETGKTIIEISTSQMNDFAGNMLQVQNTAGEKLLVMSTRAYHSLTPNQIEKLETHNRIVHAPLDTIERNGGGSARCMMAEIFLAPKL